MSEPYSSDSESSRPATETQQLARKLTVLQKAVLIQVLSAYPGQEINVSYDSGLDDASRYAQEFAIVFKAAGWQVNAIEERSDQRSVGLEIAVSPKDQMPPAALALRDALRIYGIEAKELFNPDANVKTGCFELIVGAKESR